MDTIGGNPSTSYHMGIGCEFSDMVWWLCLLTRAFDLQCIVHLHRYDVPDEERGESLNLSAG